MAQPRVQIPVVPLGHTVLTPRLTVGVAWLTERRLSRTLLGTTRVHGTPWHVGRPVLPVESG